ncbi:MAG: hypothetical protein EOO30_13350 [Comamonadaceae bacterium]|nr:MAG: hypothetical protein EOO30_13350 [Comamonadaceae bacterium]
MVHRMFAAVVRLRWGFAAACAALLLAACGGGDDGGAVDGLSPGRLPLQGDWVLRVTVDGVTSAALPVSTASVLDQAEVDALDAADVAGLVGPTLYQGGYTVTVTGATVRVVDPDSDYFLTVNTVRASGFEGCGACGVGTTVRFQVTITFTERGTLDGTTRNSTGTEVLLFEFERTG